jgi:ubiquinone/menaquinone biosynthesis C-methylase UbiE
MSDLVTDHFSARAAHYDRSSRWCTDADLAARVHHLAAPIATDHLLDVACGTGLVSASFRGKVARITGVDITPAMYAQAAPYLDQFVEAPGESLPFPDGSFDLVTCRQGIQFMDDAAAVREMARVLRPGGRVCLIHLCAYGEADRAEYFEILRLRNPARKNFYLREDLVQLCSQAGLHDATVHDFVIPEDVDVWSDNKAISEADREAIRAVYRGASPAFSEHHAVAMDDGRIIDHMLFGICIAHKA